MVGLLETRAPAKHYRQQVKLICLHQVSNSDSVTHRQPCFWIDCVASDSVELVRVDRHAPKVLRSSPIARFVVPGGKETAHLEQGCRPCKHQIQPPISCCEFVPGRGFPLETRLLVRIPLCQWSRLPQSPVMSPTAWKCKSDVCWVTIQQGQSKAIYYVYIYIYIYILCVHATCDKMTIYV